MDCEWELELSHCDYVKFILLQNILWESFNSKVKFVLGVSVLICEPTSLMFACMVDGNVTNIEFQFNH